MAVTFIELVAQHLLKYRKITNAEAFSLYGTTRLSSIISDLRTRGYPITTVMIESPNRYGNMIRYGEYRLPEGWEPEEDTDGDEE